MYLEILKELFLYKNLEEVCFNFSKTETFETVDQNITSI